MKRSSLDNQGWFGGCASVNMDRHVNSHSFTCFVDKEHFLDKSIICGHYDGYFYDNLDEKIAPNVMENRIMDNTRNHVYNTSRPGVISLIICYQEDKCGNTANIEHAQNTAFLYMFLLCTAVPHSANSGRRSCLLL